MRIILKLHFLEWDLMPQFQHDYHKAYRELSTRDNKTWFTNPARWYYTTFKFLFFTITAIPGWNVN